MYSLRTEDVSTAIRFILDIITIVTGIWGIVALFRMALTKWQPSRYDVAAAAFIALVCSMGLRLAAP